MAHIRSGHGGGTQQRKTAVHPIGAAAAVAGNGVSATWKKTEAIKNLNVESIKKCLQEVTKNPMRLEKLVTKLLIRMGGDLSHGLSYVEFEKFINACCTKKLHVMPEVEMIRIAWNTVQQHNVEEGSDAVNVKAMVNWLF